MKRMFGCAMLVIFLGAVPLLVQSFDESEYREGKFLYQDKCQFCHGMKGDGKGPAAEPLLGYPSDFTDPQFWQENEELVIEETIKNGEGLMPAFDLTPKEIKAIIGYMSQTYHKTTQSNR